ncbi:hypothetical protein D9758_010701 [Tetrapyrgos nigripes]|uniref:PLP-dependent transferase n=1 Tax=Tetrapyrgos nigripes TaxID=182062 RepID=A0A8H5LNT4_9AGAR|nr:hypothetical protein D9758_010701 [Tetrapyrgos nigripes]
MSTSKSSHPLFAALPLYSSPPPVFGHSLKKYFSFDPTYINLNHGAYGSLPSPVAEAIKPIADLAEANPDKFHRFEGLAMVIESRERLSEFIGIGKERVDEVVFVPNASHGISTVLRNFIWEEGDILLDCNTTYMSVSTTVKYLADVPPHPKISQFVMLFPTTRAKILEDWRIHVRSLQQTRVQSSSSGKLPKVVAIIDSIASAPSAQLPWVEMVQILREECGNGAGKDSGVKSNVWTLIDAAHSIGHEVDLPDKIASGDPDFLVTNCHKWMYAKRGCAVLYVPRRYAAMPSILFFSFGPVGWNQHIIKTTFPTSAAYIPLEKRKEEGEGFVAMFSWNGTIDFIPNLSVIPALQFRNWLGGEKKINDYCKTVAKDGARKIAEIFELSEGEWGLGEEELELNMVFIPLPLTASAPFSPSVNKQIDTLFKEKMLFEKNMFAANYYHNVTTMSAPKFSHPLFAPLPLYSSPPPAFGKPTKKYFSFDPTYTNLNHGSYGSLPSPVAEAIKPIADLAELNPDKFHRFEGLTMTIESRERLSEFIGIGKERVDEVVFVPNASHGTNTVLRNFIWEEGDILLDCNTTYGSVGSTIKYITDVPPHPKVSQFIMLFPTTRAKILEDWRIHVRSLQQTRVQSSSGKLPKVVAIIDSIASAPSAQLPWVEMVQILREECGDGTGKDSGVKSNVWSLIDAAHSIGHEVDLPDKIASGDPDFLVTNCHKWMYAKRGCAVLYVPKRNQHIIKTTFPTSAAYIPLDKRKEEGEGFVDMFSSGNGTIDFIPKLSVIPALQFRNWLGGEKKINDYCKTVAKDGARKMAEIFELSEGEWGLGEEELELNMVNVPLPFTASASFTPSVNKQIDTLFKEKIIFERNMFAANYYHNGKWWVRCSGQVWLEVEDFEKVARAIVDVCKEITSELALDKSE